MKTRHYILLSTVAVVLLGISTVRAGDEDSINFPWIPFDHKAIQYEQHSMDDPVARLGKKLEKGEVKLEYEPKWGYLPSLLKNLGINIDSQVLVFSKTSFQAPRISPIAPRALYFNDSVAVGTVQNGPVLELVSLDPKQGLAFYSLDIHQSERPGFYRRDMECLSCHTSPGTLNVPGMLISSVHPGADGTPSLRAGSSVTDHRSPLEERWGGWYVTGTHGKVQHMGNSVAHDPKNPAVLDIENGQNLISLEKKLDTSAYLASTSDIVALMTLEHQTRMSNLITRIGWETRMAIADGKLGEFRSRLDFAVDEMVTYMLFADEAPIREPIAGVSAFSKTFPQRGPRDRQGRSLRDFDLQKRLFRYPLSYMIYSEAFDSMPEMARNLIYHELYAVLTGALTDKDAVEKFKGLSTKDRRDIMDILRETKPGLPAYWTLSAKAQ